MAMGVPMDDRQQMTDERERWDEDQEILKADPAFKFWLDSIDAMIRRERAGADVLDRINQHHKEQIQCP